ncbi:hypothetical protein YC2023_071017 [Brassica napus]
MEVSLSLLAFHSFSSLALAETCLYYLSTTFTIVYSFSIHLRLKDAVFIDSC